MKPRPQDLGTAEEHLEKSCILLLLFTRDRWSGCGKLHAMTKKKVAAFILLYLAYCPVDSSRKFPSFCFTSILIQWLVTYMTLVSLLRSFYFSPWFLNPIQGALIVLGLYVLTTTILMPNWFTCSTFKRLKKPNHLNHASLGLEPVTL